MIKNAKTISRATDNHLGGLYSLKLFMIKYEYHT